MKKDQFKLISLLEYCGLTFSLMQIQQPIVGIMDTAHNAMRKISLDNWRSYITNLGPFFVSAWSGWCGRIVLDIYSDINAIDNVVSPWFIFLLAPRSFCLQSLVTNTDHTMQILISTPQIFGTWIQYASSSYKSVVYTGIYPLKSEMLN